MAGKMGNQGGFRADEEKRAFGPGVGEEAADQFRPKAVGVAERDEERRAHAAAPAHAARRAQWSFKTVSSPARKNSRAIKCV